MDHNEVFGTPLKDRYRVAIFVEPHPDDLIYSGSSLLHRTFNPKYNYNPEAEEVSHETEPYVITDLITMTHDLSDNRKTKLYRNLLDQEEKHIDKFRCDMRFIPLVGACTEEVHFSEATTFTMDDPRVHKIHHELQPYVFMLKDLINSKFGGYKSLLFIPFGIYHPFHKIISSLYTKYIDLFENAEVYYYIDNPYYYKKSSNLINSQRLYIERFAISEPMYPDIVNRCVEREIFVPRHLRELYHKNNPCNVNMYLTKEDTFKIWEKLDMGRDVTPYPVLSTV